MRFGLKFVSIISIAGVFAWAASAAPLQPSGQGQGFGYGYGAGKVTLCHIPPGNPDNAHTITVGASAVPAHLAHGDTLGECPDDQASAENGVAGAQETTSKGKSKKDVTPTAESSTTETEQVSPAPTPQQDQKKPKKEKPAQSNGVAQDSAPTSDLGTPGNGNGHGNGNGGGNGNAGGNGNGNANGHNK